MELGNHAEFLGVQTRSEMLAEFFVHDGKTTQAWRLKGHAEDVFWQWVCNWSAMMSNPADLGFNDAGFALPELRYHEHVIPVNHRDVWDQGYLFAPDAVTLADQRVIRRGTLGPRVAAVAGLADSTQPVLIWCEYNDEGDAITKAIPGAVQVAGADSLDVKRDRLLGFSDGVHRVLVTKPSIAGFGMNWQHCNSMIFVGASHSFEQTYQAIRRCWRYGQKRPVDVHVIRSEQEAAIVDNYKRKEQDFLRMRVAMLEHAKNALQETERWVEYRPKQKMEVPSWLR